MTVDSSERFTVLPGEEALAQTIVGLHGRGFSVEVVDDLDAARRAVLARIPKGSRVMTNTSLTLQETGIADAIDRSGEYESARTKMLALDRASQLQEMKAIAGQPDFALGSVHAITRDGILVTASALGSQLAAYAWGAAQLILVVGAQKLVRDLDAAHQRVFTYCLPLEDARALRGLRGEQSSREDPPNPRGGSGSDSPRAGPSASRILNGRRRISTLGWSEIRSTAR